MPGHVFGAFCASHTTPCWDWGDLGARGFLTGVLCQTGSHWEAQGMLKELQSPSAWPFPAVGWERVGSAASPAFWEGAGGVNKQHLLPGSRSSADVGTRGIVACQL